MCAELNSSDFTPSAGLLTPRPQFAYFLITALTHDSEAVPVSPRPSTSLTPTRPPALDRIAVNPCCSTLFPCLLSNTLLLQCGDEGLLLWCHVSAAPLAMQILLAGVHGMDRRHPHYLTSCSSREEESSLSLLHSSEPLLATFYRVRLGMGFNRSS